MMTAGDSDLNELRDILKNAQRKRQPYPEDPSQRITVGRYGQIYTGDAPDDEPVAKVHHGTFAAANAAGRLARDMAFARMHMPPNTRYIDDSDARGWVYTITTELDGRYTLFAFFDGRDYRVKLIEPELEERLAGHDGHLYSDGTICLSDLKGAGQPTLEEAYSKSVLWALGMDFVLNDHQFPFSINNG